MTDQPSPIESSAITPGSKAIDTPHGVVVHSSVASAVQTGKALLTEALGDGLVAWSLVGHAVQEGLRAGQSIQSIIVAQGNLLDVAVQIGRVGARLGKASLGPPVLMTQSYIKRSLDVFPIEYLYMQLFHYPVVNADPLAELAFDGGHVRLQCEREAKRYLLQVRQSVMLGHGDAKATRALLHELLEAVVPMFNAVLYFQSVNQPASRAAIITQLGKELDLSTECFQEVLADATGATQLNPTRLDAVLSECYRLLEQLAEWLDAHA